MQNREWNLIDFHGKFLEDYMKWSVAHPEEAAREEDSDAHYYDMYADWLDTPKDWLGGASPRGIFCRDAGCADARIGVYGVYFAGNGGARPAGRTAGG